MIKAIEGIIVESTNAKKLADFYVNKVGLKIKFEAEMGDGGVNVFGFDMGNGCDFTIIDTSNKSERNKSSSPVVISFEVDNIDHEVRKLMDSGVIKIEGIHHIEDYGYVAKFEDLDGNIFQVAQIKESA